MLTDAWLHEQEMRAQWEAEEFRRLRATLATAKPVTAPAPARPVRPGGSAILKGLVRFAIGAFGGYLGYIAAANNPGAGEVDIWFSIAAGFVIALALTAFGAGRQLVHVMAETARWMLLLAAGVALVWTLVRMNAGA